MVVIQKNWQAPLVLVTASTITPQYTPQPNSTQQPTTNTYTPEISQQSAPDLVELPEITHDETKEPGGHQNTYSITPPPIKPKKRS